jgi:hypothetical protein
MERFGAVPGIYIRASPDVNGAGECDHLGDAVQCAYRRRSPGIPRWGPALLVAVGHKVDARLPEPVEIVTHFVALGLLRRPTTTGASSLESCTSGAHDDLNL